MTNVLFCDFFLFNKDIYTAKFPTLFLDENQANCSVMQESYSSLRNTQKLQQENFHSAFQAPVMYLNYQILYLKYLGTKFLTVKQQDRHNQIPMDMVNKTVATSPTNSKKETQVFLGTMGFWSTHIPD